MDLYTRMYAHAEKLKEQIKNIQAALIKLPEGTLHVHKDGRYVKWFLHQKDENGTLRRVYLRKDQLDAARQHARATRFQARLHDKETELKATLRFLQTYDPAYRGIHETIVTHEDKLLQNKNFYSLLANYRTSRQVFIDSWKNASYAKGDDYLSNQLNIHVQDDLYVRSKSEGMIAEVLLEEKIPFRYEMRIGEGPGSILCDFVLLHPQKLEEIYLEHFGLIDQASYAGKAVDKIANYASRGIYLGINLLVTAETANHPFNKDDIRRLLQAYILNQSDEG